MAILRHDAVQDLTESASPSLPNTPVNTETVSIVKYYQSDDSIFIDDCYLVKGLPGRIFWKLVQTYLRDGGVDFTNREIRLDATLQLPDIKDNLETRLILLRRRLEDHCDFLRIAPTGRGPVPL